MGKRPREVESPRLKVESKKKEKDLTQRTRRSQRENSVQ
jgi:hypothetical protein